MIYWRLSGFYWFYFAALGALVPYWSLYLKSVGFGPVAIGELMAIMMATRIVAPNLAGWLADHTGRRMAVVRCASFLAPVAFAGVLLGHGFGWLALVVALFSFFWNAALPQFEATTLNHLGLRVHRYSRVRLWGSIGFILSVSGLGFLFQRYAAGLLPLVVLALLFGIGVTSLLVPDGAAPPRKGAPRPLLEVLGRREVAALLVVCFLMQVSHGPYYAFFTLYLEDHGYRAGLIGLLWALGVLAEIGVFLVMHRLLPRFGARSLLLASLALAALRWLLIGAFPRHLLLIVFAQTLHAASFGVYHAVAIHLVHGLFTGRHQGRGQALYSSVSFGAGAALGSLASGYLWAGLGPSAAFYGAALVAGVAWLVAWRWIPAGGVPGA
ncbi:MAG: MFS transporter [Gammaproteobacteria bacterium]